MSELKAGVIATPHDEGMSFHRGSDVIAVTERETKFYIKSEADKVIAEKDAEIRRLKNGIAPKHSDKSLQERLNEVCEKHGVPTLQDLDWAFCESEKRHTKDCIESAKMIARQKYRRCLDNAWWCRKMSNAYTWDACTHRGWTIAGYYDKKAEFYRKWRGRWIKIAEEFKEAG